MEERAHFDVKRSRIKGKCTAAEPAGELIVVYRESISHEFTDGEANQPEGAWLETPSITGRGTYNMIRGTRYGAGYRKLKKVLAPAEAMHTTMPRKK